MTINEQGGCGGGLWGGCGVDKWQEESGNQCRDKDTMMRYKYLRSVRQFESGSEEGTQRDNRGKEAATDDKRRKTEIKGRVLM